MKKYFYRFGYKAQLAAGLAVAAFMNIMFFPAVYAQQEPAPAVLNSVSDITSKVLCPVFDVMFWVILSVSTLFILWGAFTYMRAQDDAEKVTEATKTITYAALGILVALCAKAAPDVIGSVFNVQGLTSCY